MFRASLTGVDRTLGDLQGALDTELAAAALRAAGVIADDARRTHTFNNRTGELEEHIVPGEVRGSALAGTLEFDVVGEMPYGEYVENGVAHEHAAATGQHRDDAGRVHEWAARAEAYPFLEPAWEHQEGAVVQEFEQGLADAARRAGW